MTRRITRADVERELARARGARKMLPWAALTGLGGAGIGLVAGGGVRAAAVLFVLGLFFAAFVWVTSVARCPACGAPLRLPGRARRGAAPPDPAGGASLESCPRCRTRYD